MWRAFASTLCGNTYENYAKKHDRPEVYLKSTKSKDKVKKNSAKLQTVSIEAALLVHNYEYLQKKVVQQRQTIKKTDELQQQKKTIKFMRLNKQKNEEKLRKILENQAIRSLSQNKTRKIQSLDLRSKKIEAESAEESFFLTNFKTGSPGKISNRPSSQLPLRDKKTMISVRSYQEKVLKELKNKIPNYFKGLKEEFIKIRNKSEQTFEQYVDSKKIKWKNPFDIQVKKRKQRITELSDTCK